MTAKVKYMSHPIPPKPGMAGPGSWSAPVPPSGVFDPAEVQVETAVKDASGLVRLLVVECLGSAERRRLTAHFGACARAATGAVDAYLCLDGHPEADAIALVAGIESRWSDLAEGAVSALRDAEVLLIDWPDAMLDRMPSRFGRFVDACVEQRPARGLVVVLCANSETVRSVILPGTSMRCDTVVCVNDDGCLERRVSDLLETLRAAARPGAGEQQ